MVLETQGDRDRRRKKKKNSARMISFFSRHCGSDCGWDEDESCKECQEQLFNNTKERDVIFPDQHWASVSKETKDLIKKLLVKKSNHRLDADPVLLHSWIITGGSHNILETPKNL